MSTEKQIQFWDDIAEDIEFQKEIHLLELEKTISKNSNILDFGCGYGRVMATLNKHGYTNIEGVDSSKQMVKRGEKENPNLQIKHIKPFSTLPYVNSLFDVIIVVDVFVSIIDNKLQILTIDELNRVLKPTGIIYIYDFLLSKKDRNVKRYKEYQGKYPYGTFILDNGLAVRHLSKERIYELTSNFKAITFDTFDCLTLNGNITDGFFYIGQKSKI